LPDDDWIWQDKAPWVTGEFVWTGFDYLGEPTPYDDYWPSRSSYFGIFDLAGLPKDRAFLYRTHWAPEEKTLHVLPHWTFPNRKGQVTPVFVYTSYPEAELFINGKSQGRKRHIDMTLDDYRNNRIDVKMPWGDMSKFADPNAPEGKNRLDRYRLRWMNVKYEPGEIKVVAYDKNGNKAEEKIIKTAGKPHHLVLEADRNTLTATPLINGMPQDSPDLSFVTVSVVDKDGNLCPDAANQLTFSVSGSAKFNSVCNGDATSTEDFTKPTMKAFHGQLVVVVEATATAGKATLKVAGKGLQGAEIALEIK
jgi:beta-galactosidase